MVGYSQYQVLFGGEGVIYRSIYVCVGGGEVGHPGGRELKEV